MRILNLMVRNIILCISSNVTVIMFIYISYFIDDKGLAVWDALPPRGTVDLTTASVVERGQITECDFHFAFDVIWKAKSGSSSLKEEVWRFAAKSRDSMKCWVQSCAAGHSLIFGSEKGKRAALLHIFNIIEIDLLLFIFFCIDTHSKNADAKKLPETPASPV